MAPETTGSETTVELETRGRVGVVWFDRRGGGPNLLDRNALASLPPILERLEEDREITSIVVASRNDHGFIAGADIGLFAQLSDRESSLDLLHQSQALFERLANLPKPKVAAIDGTCAGGGLELALACDYRIASTSAKTNLSLPEVQLGLLPALGGTQRLPRLIGLTAGLDLLLTGRKLYARAALKTGLVDATIHQEGLTTAALAAARRFGDGGLGRRRAQKGPLDRLLELGPARELVLNRALEKTRRTTRGNYPAPEKIIETVRRSYGGSLTEGLRLEALAFVELLFTPQSRALRHLFFVRTRTRKNPYAEHAREVRRLGVLGAGLMGAGIAQVAASPAGYRVVLKDQSFELAARGKGEVYRGLSRKLGKGLTPFERDSAMERVTVTDDYAGFDRVDLTIEAVLEDLELKRKVLAEVEERTGGEHIFASNTSSLPIGEIAASARRPTRVVGMHYFSPVPQMPLLEVVRGPQTSEEALGTAITVGLKQGKNVIVVRDSPGFYVNRILAPYLDEALTLVEEGAAIDEVDATMEASGFPVGPFRLLDNVGLDVAGKAVRAIAPIFRDRGVPFGAAIERLTGEGLQGRKGGLGFYRYDGRGGRRVNLQIYRVLAAPKRRNVPAAQTSERLLLALVNEAVHCLHEGIIASRDDGDAGAVFGLGFPPFLGGPFHYLESVGASAVRERLLHLEERFGPRFRPAPGLLD